MSDCAKCGDEYGGIGTPLCPECLVEGLRGRIGPLLHQHDNGINITILAANEIEQLNLYIEEHQSVNNLLQTVLEQKQEIINRALDVAEYGAIDGGHHKMWVIDQMIRILADDYEAWVTEFRNGEDGPDTYGWDEGIAP